MIRPYRGSDVPALTELAGETEPERPAPTPAGFRHWIESQPARALFRAWVAEEEGALVGYVVACLSWSIGAGDIGFVWAGVAERARGRSIGSALFAVGERHLHGHPVRRLESFALTGSPGERFALARGFRQTRTELVQRLDLGAADLSALGPLEARARAEGFRLTTLADVAERKAGLHALYAAVSSDIPADEPEDDIRLEDFERHVLGDPELDPDGSAVVLHDETPVALAFVLGDHERGVGANELTGTLPEFRGRGLARLAKLATVRWARERGFRELVTENDGENAAMRGLNASLGYRVTHVHAVMARDQAPGVGPVGTEATGDARSPLR